MISDTTTTSSEAEKAESWWCSICKKRGHTAEHHKSMPEIYEEGEKKDGI